MSARTSIGERHLSMAGLDKYISRHVPILHPIAGEPAISLFIDPGTPELGVRIHNVSDEELPNISLRHIDARRTWTAGQWCFDIAIVEPSLFRDGYPLLCALADRIQIDRLRPAAALRVSVRQLGLLLRPNDLLSKTIEVGLFGELLTLGGLIRHMGPKAAISAWRGGAGEEHDFGLPDLDVEVKTTATERRVHWIESLTQLLPTGSRPLWLVSHQLTPAGLDEGCRLPSVIERIRDSLDSEYANDAFELGLSGAGWTDDFESTCTTAWTKRTPSYAYPVANDFPRLTPGSITGPGANLAHLPEVKYQIDLTGISAASAPTGALAAAITFEESDD